MPSSTILGIPTSLTITVTRVIDGDTFDVAAVDGGQDRIRLLGVDTPEVSGPNKPNEYGDITDTACLDDWGIRAKEFAADKLEGRVVTLVMEGTTFGELFTFGRLLAFVELYGVDFNRLLLELGLARAYTEASNGRGPEYLEIQQQAQASKAGLWACREGAPAPSALSGQGATPTFITQATPGPSPIPATTSTPTPTPATTQDPTPAPTTSSTTQPTATPTPSLTPTATPQPIVTPTPVTAQPPTPSPTPLPGPTPVPTVTPAPIAAPTSTPPPTPTSLPPDTPTPMPTSTATPTPTALPSPTATPTPTPTSHGHANTNRNTGGRPN